MLSEIGVTAPVCFGYHLQLLPPARFIITWSCSYIKTFLLRFYYTLRNSTRLHAVQYCRGLEKLLRAFATHFGINKELEKPCGVYKHLFIVSWISLTELTLSWCRQCLFSFLGSDSSKMAQFCKLYFTHQIIETAVPGDLSVLTYFSRSPG